MTSPAGTVRQNWIPTKKGYVITKSNIFDLKKRDESNTDLLTELFRSRAQQLITEAVKAERQ